MQRRPINKAQQSINFLSHTSNESLRILGVSDRFGIILRERRFIEKNDLMKIVKYKVDHMLEEVQQL